MNNLKSVIIKRAIILKRKEMKIKKLFDKQRKAFFKACKIVAKGKSVINIYGVKIIKTHTPDLYDYYESNEIAKLLRKLEKRKKSWRRKNEPSQRGRPIWKMEFKERVGKLHDTKT